MILTNSQKLNAFLLTACSLFGADPAAFAWGKKGHDTVNDLATEMIVTPRVGQFMRKHRDRLGWIANTPDCRWKSGPSAEQEKPLHFFQVDGYEGSKLGSSIPDVIVSQARRVLGAHFVKENGLAVWRIGSLYRHLVKAIADEQWPEVIQLAGVLGHYVGDMAQPMHMTSDYDGQSIKRPGIHMYYETTAVDQISTEHLQARVLTAGGPHRSELERVSGLSSKEQGIRRFAYAEGVRAFRFMPKVISYFKEGEPNNEAIYDEVAARMGYGAATLAKIWDMAFAESGIEHEKIPLQRFEVEEPEWIPLD